jgi:hypothetical protein
VHVLDSIHLLLDGVPQHRIVGDLEKMNSDFGTCPKAFSAR